MNIPKKKILFFFITDDTFDGELADNIDAQVNLVKLFAKQFLSNGKEFQNVTEVCDARVPIVKFYHIPTQLNCDVSFKSGLSLFNSKLIWYIFNVL